MYVELKKVKLSKSIIQQIEPAGSISILNQGEILGWCFWNFGTPSKPLKKNLIIFFNKDGNLRKLTMFDSVKDGSFEYDIDPFNSVLGRKTKYKLIVKRSRMIETEYQFDTKEEMVSFEGSIQRLKRIAIEKGQFFY